MKYEYDADLECFVRVDGLGKKFWINSSEAQKICTLQNLGYSIPKITHKINFSSDKVTESTIINFCKNVSEGNIIVDGDYPAPRESILELTMDTRIDNLEERVGELENRLLQINELLKAPMTFECDCAKVSIMDKVKSWLKY